MNTRLETQDRFDEFAHAIRPRLLRLVIPMLGNRHDAEDAVQEALLGLWKRREQVDDWAAYAARATWLNGLKRKGRKREWLPLEDEHPSPLIAMAAAKAWELERAIDGLPLAQQAVIRLRFYAGQSFHEIGEALQISLHTAASRCRYALKALRDVLNDDKNQTKKGVHDGEKRAKNKRL